MSTLEFISGGAYIESDSTYDIFDVRDDVYAFMFNDPEWESKTRSHFDGIELTPLHIANIDRLIDTDSDKQRPALVDFAKEVYRSFSKEEISAVLQEIYENRLQKKHLSKFADEKEINDDIYSYSVDTTGPEVAVVRGDVSINTMETKSLTEKTVKMENFAGRVHLGESQVIECIDDLIEMELEQLWHKMDCSSKMMVNNGIYIDAIIETYDTMYSSNGSLPDLLLTDRSNFNIHEIEAVFEQNSGVVDIPFVMGEKEAATRIVQQPITVWKNMDLIFDLSWRGNYIVPHPEKFAGPP